MDPDTEVESSREEIQTKEGEVDQLKVESCTESGVLQSEIHTLKDQVQGLNESLKSTIEQLQAKENLLTQKEIEISQEKDKFESMITTSEEEMRGLKEQIQTKGEQLATLEREGSTHSDMLQEEIQCLKSQLSNMGDSLTKAEEKVQAQLVMLTKQEQESGHQMDLLQQQLSSSEEEVMKMKEEIQAKEEQVTLLKTDSSVQSDLLHQEIKEFKKQIECLSLSLKNAENNLQSKDELFAEQQLQSTRDTESLQEQMASSQDEVKKLNTEIHAKEEQLILLKTETTTHSDVLQQEIQCLKTQLSNMGDSLTKAEEKVQAQLVMITKQEQESGHQMDLLQQHMLSSEERVRSMKEEIQTKGEQLATLERDGSTHSDMLQQEITCLKSQLCNMGDSLTKQEQESGHQKELLQQQLSYSEEEVRKMKDEIQAKEEQVRLLKTDGSVQLELLHSEIQSLKTQAELLKLEKKKLLKGREQTEALKRDLQEQLSAKSKAAEHYEAQMEKAMSHYTGKKQLLQDSHGKVVELKHSLEVKEREVKATTVENTQLKLDLDKAQTNEKALLSRVASLEAQKTPGGGEDDETFYSLSSARSNPNLFSSHSALPVALESFDTPARMPGAASDQLIGLPGYRRSTVYSQPASTFCAGVENEPEGGPDDWRRIVELQTRNKACLPHLKSSYPVESDTCRGSTFLFTDEELRMGDPSDTIRQASTMPGQLQDALASHRVSFMAGHSGAAASTLPHRLTLMPGQLPSKTVGTKRSASTLAVHHASPEKRVKASSCFPRPLTPKSKISGPSSSQLRPALSPAGRRESMMFSIENTPQKSNYLKKGLRKLRSSTRKSPGKSSQKSPAHTSARNLPSGSLRASRGSKLPQVDSKGQRATTRSTKSPLTASKMMSRLKV